MRKLKLQMQVSIDGYVAGPNGEMDWMTWDWDDKLQAVVTELTATTDTILMGRKLAEGFIPYWKSVYENPQDPQFEFGKLMYTTPKVVFSKNIQDLHWENSSLTDEDLVETVNQLKNKEGKDIIVYGGANFVSNLIENKLIDELYLFINPAAIGSGLKIFQNLTKLQLINSTAFNCGIVVNCYKQVQ